MRKPLPDVFNRTEWEWRRYTHNHAVKLDAGHDGWEAMCGMKFTHFYDIRFKEPASAGRPFCKRCLAKTKSTLAIIPNHRVKECFEI